VQNQEKGCVHQGKQGWRMSCACVYIYIYIYFYTHTHPSIYIIYQEQKNPRGPQLAQSIWVQGMCGSSGGVQVGYL